MAGQKDMDLFLEKLPEREAKRLDELETVIRKNMKSFFAVGIALTEIRDNRLYRGTHWTFEDYVKEIFEIGKASAYRYIGAAEVIFNIAPGVDLLDNNSHILSPMGDKILQLDDETIQNLPNERQLRPLTKLKPEEQKTVWQQAKETAPDGKITAKHVQKTIFDILGSPEKQLPGARREVRNEEKMDAGFKAAFESFILQIEKARHEKYKKTSWVTVMTHLDTLREVIADDGAKIMRDPVALMEKADRQKLMNAGFRLFRRDWANNLIEEQAKDGNWFVFRTCQSEDEAAVDFDNLMQHTAHLRG